MSDLARWDDRYLQSDTPWETGHPSTELQRAVQDETIPRGRAIDLGCGSGANAVWLAQQGFNVVGVDFSPTAIDRARQRATDAGVAVQFHAADVLRLPELGTTFKFFFDRGCYHVLRRSGQATCYVQVVKQLMAPGSQGLVLAGNAREKLVPGPPVVTEEQLRADWSDGFEFRWLREFRFDLNMVDTSRPLGWAAFLRRSAA
jgi:SAM-dependent methyltransferase